MSERLVAAVHARLEVLALAAEAQGVAATLSINSDDALELVLVISELGMNAVRHGGGGLMKVSLSPVGWTVEVEDGGPGFSPAVLADAGRSDHLGRDGSGLARVRRLSSRIELSNRPRGGARVAAHKGLSSSRKGKSS